MAATVEVGAVVRKIAEDFQKLKAAYEKKDNGACVKLIDGIKPKLIQLPTFLNPTAKSGTRAEELMLTRSVLEYAVLVSARQQDIDSFELFFNQLNVYYTDIGVEELPQSPLYLNILGLNLVRLLIGSSFAKFHAELEKIPSALHGPDNFIRFPVQLERYLMEGSYNMLLNSRDRAPSGEYVAIVTLLESTVRQEVAKCIPKAYTHLSLSGAQKVLMVDSVEDVKEFGRLCNWQLSPDGSSFIFSRKEDLARKEVPFHEMLAEHMHFAADMQQIV